MSVWRQRNGRAGWLLQWLRDLNFRICPGCKVRQELIDTYEEMYIEHMGTCQDPDTLNIKSALKESEKFFERFK